MPIYSGNRTGSANIVIEADTSYGANDIGRIMYETEHNDQAIFEAILKSDFREIKGIREGTILKSEIASLNEASIKNLFNTIKEAILKLMNKLAGLAKNFIAAISAFLDKNGKKAIKDFDKKFDKSKFTSAEVEVVEDGYVNLEVTIDDISNTDGFDKTGIIQHALAKALKNSEIDFNDDTVTPENFAKILTNATLPRNDDNTPKTTIIGSNDVDELITKYKNVLSQNSTYIKNVKNTHNNINKSLKFMYNTLKVGGIAEKLVNGGNESINIANITAAYNGYCAAYNIMFKEAISISKKVLTVSKNNLNKILAGCKSSEKSDAAPATGSYIDSVVFAHELNKACNMPVSELKKYYLA